MEICENGEAFVEEDGDPVFDHTKLILRRGDEYFYARANWRKPITFRGCPQSARGQRNSHRKCLAADGPKLHARS